MEQNTLEVTEQTEVFSFTSIRELVNETLKTHIGQTPSLPGTPSGFRDLDKVTGGFQKGQLTTVAVRPGMGKTAFLLSVANNLAVRNQYSVAVFSSERSSRKMTTRLIETETGMSVDQLKNGRLKASEKDHMRSLVNSIARAKIFIDDTPYLPVMELVRKCRQLKQQQQVDLVIVDYVELLTIGPAHDRTRGEQLLDIMYLIKKTARELDIPFLLFSQFQGVPSGFGSASDNLREDLPAYLWEPSDVVMVLHRSDLDPRHKKQQGKSMVELIVANKEAGSERQVVPLAFIESISKFTDPS